MELNTLKPAPGSKHVRKRVARGIGSGAGKNGGRRHKGQRARSGGLPKVGFEGGPRPLQRRRAQGGAGVPASVRGPTKKRGRETRKARGRGEGSEGIER